MAGKLLRSVPIQKLFQGKIASSDFDNYLVALNFYLDAPLAELIDTSTFSHQHDFLAPVVWRIVKVLCQFLIYDIVLDRYVNRYARL